MTSLRLSGRGPILKGGIPLPGNVTALDLRELEWVTPFDLVALAVICGRGAGAGSNPDILFPGDDTVRRYLVDAGIAEHLRSDWGPGGGSVAEPPLVRLTRLETGDDWDEELKTLWPHVRGALGDFKTAGRTLDIMSELVDNATSHGRSDIGTYVCAQRYTGAHSALEPGVWIGVADGGIGIPTHLRGREEYAGIEADEELIRLARRAGVTGTRDRRGYGFHEVFEDAAAAGRSRLLIRAGHGEGDFWMRAGNRVHARYRRLPAPIPGTWIHIRMEPP